MRQFPYYGTPNARFWVYWNGDFTKITLRDGDEIAFWQGGPTDEGWTLETHVYRHEGNRVESVVTVDGCDCDGRLTRHWEGYCSLDNLRAVEAEPDPMGELRDGLPARPQWEKLSSGQYDQFAEQAGY